MKILLVNPINPSYYYRFGLIFPPLGLGYLSAALKQHGHEVKIIDMNIEKFDFQNYHYADYDLVGISSDTVRFPWAEYIAKCAKAQGVKVVMGGPHPSVDAYNILKSKTADYVVLGEGEESFVNLVNAVEKGERYSNIGGVGYVNEKGEVHLSAMKFISNLDSIPFPD